MWRDIPGAGCSKSTDMGSKFMMAEEQTPAKEEMREGGKIRKSEEL